MITSAAELSDFEIDESPRFERIARGAKVVMPTRAGGQLHSQRARSRARNKAISARSYPGAHQRRRRKVK